MRIGADSVKGLFKEFQVAAIPGEKLSVFGGETVRVTVTLEYRGPAIDDRLYGAIGERAVFFDEIWAGTSPVVSFAQSTDWRPYTLTVDIPTSVHYPHVDYDLMVKLLAHPHIFTELYDCIDVIGVAEFRNLQITEFFKA